ncbi:caspase family protein [Streptomyces sp. SM13]|uniref:caspase, EACC1-associated type n=1 Tax=Streptomyces sp. SM13 TaxID=1983803 RepID=UPI000CD4F101|nr:caspase family protein [Streptomyces sp. SM13]
MTDGSTGTTGGALTAPGAHAVLFGTGTQVPGAELPDLPSVDATLDDVQLVLSEACGMDPRQMVRVPAAAGPSEVIDAVEKAVERGDGPVLFYYVGHGLLGPRDELYLATRACRSARQIAPAVPYRTLRDLLGEAPHGSLVILDCCFSGRAEAPPSDGGTRGPFESARPRGSFLLSSASHYALSFAPDGDRHTLFSGRLLRLLTQGDPAGPPWLSLDDLHTALEREFAEDRRVRPARRSEGSLGSLLLTRNRAYVPDSGRPAQAEPPADVLCPYPGLEPFRTEDTGHFFGRAELTVRLIDAVEGNGREDGVPVVLVGASGAGKSSLLRAGLLAGLEARESRGPTVLVPAPGERPLDTLAHAWASATGRQPDEVRASLAAGRLPGPAPGRATCWLLVVDQFEEVFTRCPDPGERAAFVTALTSGSRGGPQVVLGLRADHYGSCLEHPGLELALARAVTVPPMRDRELRAAVEGPAAAVGLVLEPGLTDRLLHDLREGRPTADAGGATPFLAHALRETWLRRSGVRLTLAGYQATGGIWESVATTGERLCSALDDEGRRRVRELLLSLVHLPRDGGAPVPRHRVPLADLPEGTEKIRDRLARARLLTVGRDTAQLAHEALLRAWPRLADWIKEDAATLLLRQQVRTAAEEWDAAGRDAAFLHRGSRLQAVLALPGRAALPARERDFLAAAEEAAERERLRQARRRKNLQRGLMALALALVVTVAATVVAVRQWHEAREQQELATARALLAQAETLRTADPQTALRLGLAAHELNASVEARRSLSQTLSGPFRGSRTFYGAGPVFSPDGLMLATRSADEVSLWRVGDDPEEVSRLARLPCLDPIGAGAMAFGGPDGDLLAATCQDGVALWDLTGLGGRDGPQRLPSPRDASLPGTTRAVALDERGTVLAAVVRPDSANTSDAAGGGDAPDERGALVLWDLSDLVDRQRPRLMSVTRGVNEADSVMFGPDGRTLATVADSRIESMGVRVWDIADPGRPKPGDRIPADRITAFSPDGRLLVTVWSRDVTVFRVLPRGRVEVLAEWPATASFFTDVVFSPDGRRLATSSFNGVVDVWDITDPGEPVREHSLGGPNRRIEAAAFGADGRTLRTVGGNTLTHWDFTSAARVVGTVRTGLRALSLAATPDGSTLAFNAREGIELWDVRDRSHPEHTGTVPAHEGGSSDLSFSADGTLLAAVFSEAVEVWNVADPDRPRRLLETPCPRRGGARRCASRPRRPCWPSARKSCASWTSPTCPARPWSAHFPTSPVRTPWRSPPTDAVSWSPWRTTVSPCGTSRPTGRAVAVVAPYDCRTTV